MVRRHPWLFTLAVSALLVVLLVLFWNWNWFKGPIERRVEARTGRAFKIGGDLDVDLGRIATIRADALSFGNARWAKEPIMASAERLEFRIEVLPLLFRRETRIPDIRLSKPRLRLEKDSRGMGNWKFGQQGSGPSFRRLWIDDGKLRFLDVAGRTDIDLAIDSLSQRRDDAAPPIEVKGGGRWKDNKFTLNGRAESPLDLRDKRRPYRIDLHAQAGDTKAHARGTLLDPLRLRDFDLQLMLSGRDMAELYPLVGVATPTSPPYKLDGQFTRDGNTWHYDNFTGTVGESDLAGDASVETGRERAYLRANLLSKRLDFDDLAGFVGASPTMRGQKTDEHLAANAARRAARGRMLPDTPYEFERLRGMDANLRWVATRIDAPKLPLDNMDAHLTLENGLLRLHPLNFGVAGGSIRSEIRMDARAKIIQTRADITARGLELRKLLPTVKLAEDAVGKVGGKIKVSGNGNSIDRMLATADGDFAFGMGRGQISNLVMEWAGLDFAEAVKFLIEGDRKIPIRCAFGDFSVADGIMKSRGLAFDTTDTIIVGEGTVSLRDERLDLILRPRPKDRSLFSFRSPLLLTGTFEDPSFRPDFKRVGLRAAIALTLGSILPPAALLATIETGPGEDSNCGGPYAK
ncbi:MAG: AsmA family protein [Lysobacterales bacterium]